MEAIDGLKEGVVAILDEVQRWLDGRDGTTLSEWLDRQEAEARSSLWPEQKTVAARQMASAPSARAWAPNSIESQEQPNNQPRAEAARRRRRTAFHVGRRKGDGTWT